MRNYQKLIIAAVYFLIIFFRFQIEFSCVLRFGVEFVHHEICLFLISIIDLIFRHSNVIYCIHRCMQLAKWMPNDMSVFVCV